MLYKPTYASPHLIAYDIPFEEKTADTKERYRLTLEFDVSGNNCIGYKIYIKNIKDDVWTDLNTDSKITVSFGDKATPVTKQTGSKIYGTDTKNNDKIFVLNTVANNGDRIVFDAWIEGYTFVPNETYQWKVQFYDDSYLNKEGYGVYKKEVSTYDIYYYSNKYRVDIRSINNARIGMYVRQWVKPREGQTTTNPDGIEGVDYITSTINNAEVIYYPIIRKIVSISKSYKRVYAFVDGALETDENYWMPTQTSQGTFNTSCTPIDILQDLTITKEYSLVGYGVIQNVSQKNSTNKEITLQKHYNVRENMLLLVSDSNGKYLDTSYRISNPVVNEVKQNMTIKVISNDVDKNIIANRYYKIYSYFVESDAYTFEYNESPTVDFMPSVNEEAIIEDKPYLNVKFPSETFIGTYNHSTEEVVSYSFEVKCEGKTVARSGEIYSANISFTIDGLIDGKTYTIIMNVVDTKNRTIVKEKSYTAQYIGEVIDRKVSEVKATYTNQKFCVLLENCLYTSNSGEEKKREHMILYRLSPRSHLMERVIEQGFDEGEFQNNVDVVADYKIGNEMDYQYIAFSDVQVCGGDTINNSSQDNWTENDGTIWTSTCYIRSSPIVHIECDSYVVMDLVPFDESNAATFEIKRYRPKTLWSFEFNIEEGNMVQNLSKEQYLTLSNFPKISKTKRNYISSSLSCYIGGVDMYEDYIDNKTLIDKWEEFCASDSKKVLKDTKGNLFEIEVLNPQYKNELTAFRVDKNGYMQSPTTIQFDWVQIGDMDKESISISGHARTIKELDTLVIDELDDKSIFDVSYKWEFDDIPIPENRNGKQY